MHNSIGCNLVAVDYPGTVDCHHLYVLIVVTEEEGGFLLKLQLDYWENMNDNTHSIGVMVDIEAKVIVHRRDRHSVLQIFG